MPYRFAFSDIDTGVFPACYALARKHWLELSVKLSYPQRHLPYPCAGSGPGGEALVTDTVWVGDFDADRVLVLIAGTHGIEGFAGSAVEIDLLRLLIDAKMAVPKHAAVLMIHALTPWGYAWQRRCDADGVDLNRNAVDFAKPLPENSEYQRLRPALFMANAEQRRKAFAEFGQRYGRAALDKAISGGQYLDPTGPFYGGKAPAHGRLVCEDLIRRYQLPERRLAVIDLHTGLGSYGCGEIICDHSPGSAGAAVARQWYGDSVTLPMAGTSSSVPKLGLLDYAWHAVMNEQSCYVTLEFGTYSTDELFEVLLRDHQIWAQTGSEATRFEHSQAMRRHFYPKDRTWQELVLFRARQVIGQALKGVAS